MLGPLKSYSSIDRYLLPLAAIQVVLLITMIFYSLVLVRETAYSHTGHYKLQPIVFSNIQGGSRFEETLTQLELEKKKLQKILVYFSNDFVNAILKYFWFVSPQSLVDFRDKGAEVVLALDEHDRLLRKTVGHARPSEIEEQLIFEEVNKLVLRLIDSQSPSHQVVAMQRKGLLLMRLINHSLLSQNTGLSEQLVLEIKGDLNEFQEILNAFKSGNKKLKIDRLRDQRAQKSLSIIENSFESVKKSALKAMREETNFFELGEAQTEKIGALEMLLFASKQLNSELDSSFSRLTTSANVLAIMILEMLIAVAFLITIILKKGPHDSIVEAKFRVSESLLEETANPIPSEELPLNISEEADVILDRLEDTIVKQVDDLLLVSDFNEQLGSLNANLRILAGVFEFFRLKKHKKDIKYIVQNLKESEENKNLDSEKLLELIMDLQKIVGSVSFKRELGALR